MGYISRYMRRSLFLQLVFILVSLALFATPAQFPSGTDDLTGNARNAASITGTTSAGNSDRVSVIFFEIPIGTPGSLYFAVNHAGHDTNDPVDTGVVGSEYSLFSLLGGVGTYSNPDARLVRYSSGGQARTGTVLDSFTSINAGTPAGWTAYNPVSPSQGELIGNKYYFKIVVDASFSSDVSDWKNGFQVDVFNDAGLTGTVANARAFAYNWCLTLPDAAYSTTLYPYVPEAINGTSDYIVVSNSDYDFDGANPVLSLEDSLGTTKISSGNMNVSGDPSFLLLGNTSVTASAGEEDSAWRLQLSQGLGVGYENPAEFWVWQHSPPPAYTGVGTGINDDTTYPSGSDTVYRIYSSPPVFLSPDAVVINADKANAVSGIPDDGRVIVQVVDSAGDPVPYQRDVTFSVTAGSAVFESASNGVTGIGTNSYTLTTDADGFGWITFGVGPGVNNELNTIQASWAFGTPGNVSDSITFYNEPNLSLSSASPTNIASDVGANTTLPAITILDSATVSDTVNEVYIRIPGSLGVLFDNGSTLSYSNAPLVSNAVFENTALVADNRSLHISFSSPLPRGVGFTINGLDIASDVTVSSGELEMAWGTSTSWLSDSETIQR